MSQTSNSWVGCWVCIIIVVGIITFLISPILGAIVTIPPSLTILFVLLLQSKKNEEAVPESNRFFTLHSESEKIIEDAEVTHSESVRVRVLDADKRAPDSKTTVTKQKKEAQTENAVENLQKRIAQLEKQIELLNEQLAEEPLMEPPIELITPDFSAPSKTELDSEADELTIFAIKHLLDTLDEKFAKRAISEQLYNRLRDKYLARLTKAERRSENSSNRGNKKTRIGDH